MLKEKKKFKKIKQIDKRLKAVEQREKETRKYMRKTAESNDIRRLQKLEHKRQLDI